MMENTALSMRAGKLPEATILGAELSSGRPEVDLPSFTPRAPWLSADLQTMRNFVVRRFGGVPSNLPGQRLYLKMRDGSGRPLGGNVKPKHAHRAAGSASPRYYRL